MKFNGRQILLMGNLYYTSTWIYFHKPQVIHLLTCTRCIDTFKYVSTSFWVVCYSVFKFYCFLWIDDLDLFLAVYCWWRTNIFHGTFSCIKCVSNTDTNVNTPKAHKTLVMNTVHKLLLNTLIRSNKHGGRRATPALKDKALNITFKMT